MVQMISGVREAKTFLNAVYQRSEDSSHKGPYVTLTYAQSLDGKITGPGGKQINLSSNESMAMTHRLRVINDGILIGIGTLLKDDPRLTARIVEPDEIPVQPQPIILDSQLQFPLKSNLILSASQGGGKYPWVFCAPDHSPQRRQALEAAGIQVFVVSKQGDKLSIPEILRKIEELGIRKLMVEGGANVIREFLASGYVDLCVVTLAPIYIGGTGVSFIENGDSRPLSKLSDIRYHQFGMDMVVAGYALPAGQGGSQNHFQQTTYPPGNIRPPNQQLYGENHPSGHNSGYPPALLASGNQHQEFQTGSYPQRPYSGIYPPNPEGGPPLPPRNNTSTNSQTYPPKIITPTQASPDHGSSQGISYHSTIYPPKKSSGYPPQVVSGYPPQATSGYPPQATCGYPPMGSSGYPPQAITGYPPLASSGYPSKVTSVYPPKPVQSGYPPQGGVYPAPKITPSNQPPPLRVSSPPNVYPPSQNAGYPPKNNQSEYPSASGGYPPAGYSTSSNPPTAPYPPSSK